MEDVRASVHSRLPETRPSPKRFGMNGRSVSPGTVSIRPATASDAAEIAALYAHHVLHGTATFELDPPDAAEICARLGKVRASGLPWLIARQGKALLGYAYAALYHPRPAYRYTCEDSIYIAPDRRGERIGAALLAQLLADCEAAGFRQMIALIAATEPASLAIHARFGFRHAGQIEAVGRKHGQWIDVVHMQRALGDGASTRPQGESNE